MINEYQALVVICKALRPFMPDVMTNATTPAPDASSRNIQWMFWQIDEQDKIASSPSRVKAITAKITALPWNVSLTPQMLIDGMFRTVDDLHEHVCYS